MLLVVCHLCKKLAEVWESVRLHSRNVAHSRFLPWDIYIYYSRRRCHCYELTIVFRSILALMVLPGYVAPIRFRLSGEWWDIMCFIAGSSASNGQIGQEIARKQEQRPPQTSHPIISCCARTWPWCSNLQSTFCFAFCFFSTDASSGPNNNPNLPNAQCLAFTCRMLTQIYLQFCIVIYCCWQSIHHGPEFISKWRFHLPSGHPQEWL